MLREKNVRAGLVIVLAALAAALLAAPLGVVRAQDGGACGESVVVQAGDTLSSIGRTCGVTVAALLAANPAVTNADRIYVEQVLDIPEGVVVAPQATLVLSPAEGPPGSEFTATLTGGPVGAALAGSWYYFDQAGTRQELWDILLDTDSTGALTQVFTIPDDALPGQRYVVELNDVAQSNEFVVREPGQGGGGTGGPGIYVVQPGDTLFGIAQANGVTVADLLAANPQIVDANRIYVGAEVRISGSDGSGGGGSGGGSAYVVQPGDNLFRIALNHGTTVQALMDANPAVADPTRIYVGQVLVLP